MPSDRKQINVRLDDETEARVERLLPAVSAVLGLKVSQSDLFRLGMIELERKYGTGGQAVGAGSAQPAEPKKPRSRKKMEG